MKISKALGASLLTAALVAGPVCAATAAPAQAAIQSVPAVSDLFEASNRQTIVDTFDGINAFRATKGLKALKFNVSIAAISQRWSAHMASWGEFVHNSDYVTGAPVGWDSASENIAWYTYAPSGQRFVDMWINSPGHNANMSRAGDDYMGIGISSSNGRLYATANHFSYPDGVVPPGSYNSPRDYFNGLPALPPGPVVVTQALEPAFDTAKGTYTIPSVVGVDYVVYSPNEPTATKRPGAYPAGEGTLAIQAVAKPGYLLSNRQVYWMATFTESLVTAGAPVFDMTARTVTIPAATGVQYSLNGNAVDAGRYTGPGKVVVTATAKPGFKLSAGTISWSRDYIPPVVQVAATAPTFNRTKATYTIPAKTGVTYLVDGAVKAAGTYARSTKVTVNARAAAGYSLTGTATWSYDLAPLPVTAAAPTFNSAAGTYTIPKKAGVTYFADGTAVAAGTFKGNSRRVALTAKATAGYKLSGTSAWTFDFRRAVGAVKPVMNSATDRYTIPKQSGVAFYVDGRLMQAGTYKVANGKTLKFTAKASVSTVRLTGTAAWSFRF